MSEQSPQSLTFIDLLNGFEVPNSEPFSADYACLYATAFVRETFTSLSRDALEIVLRQSQEKLLILKILDNQESGFAYQKICQQLENRLFLLRTIFWQFTGDNWPDVSREEIDLYRESYTLANGEFVVDSFLSGVMPTFIEEK